MQYLVAQEQSPEIQDNQTKDYPLAQQSETIVLNDGDNFDLSAEMISKELDGQKVAMLGYNASIPGPTIKVTQNSTIKVNFINNTPFENTLHSHGIRVENAFDGVPDLTQKPVQPGESFEYKLNAFVVESEEENKTMCLGVIKGQVQRFPKGLTVPQIGWNKVTFTASPLFNGVEQDSYFYFVHSYYVKPTQSSLANSEYGINFCSAVQKDNFYGVQFHPEKSGIVGEKLLSNFIKLC